MAANQVWGKQRQFKRYDVSFCESVGGFLPESEVGLRLISLGMGGCGFTSFSTDPKLIPPKEVVCSFYRNQGDSIAESQVVVGHLIYIRPVVHSAGMSFQYGVRFHDQDRQKMAQIISHLDEISVSEH